MTQVTPAGWYPDPGQTSDAPPTERWWDGRAWTDQTRPAGQAAAWGSPQAPAYGGQPGHPGYPPAPPEPSRRGLRIGIAVAAAVAVLASIGVGVWALTGNDGGSGGSGTAQGPGRSGGQDGGEDDPFGGRPGDGSPSPGQSEPPKIRSGSVTDALNGISIPIPDGWTGQELSVGAQITSDASYKCPGDTSKNCTEGGVYSAPVEALGTKGSTAESVAKADIARNAEESYGGSTYGAITSHEVLASKAVTVAGQKGYLVRWKAVTSKGADGVVESLVFSAPANPKRLVVLRFGVDADKSTAVIDEITRGVKVSTGGGSGQDV